MKDLPSNRLTKAERSIQAAQRDLEAGQPDIGTSRAYYAMFYVAEALLAERGFSYRKHGAVHGAFAREFVVPGTLDAKYHRWLLHAFEQRLQADYGAEVEIAPEDVETMISRAEKFLKVARIYLGAMG